MNNIPLFATAISLAADAFGVAISSGMQLKKPSFKIMIKFGCYFGFFQFIMPIIGYLISSKLSSSISAYGNIISFVLLVAIGVNMIIASLKKSDFDEDNYSSFSFKNMCVMAIATSIDAMAVGFTFTFQKDINLLPSASIIGIFAFILSMLGVYIGCKTGDILKNKGELIGGIVLIIIGIKSLL